MKIILNNTYQKRFVNIFLFMMFSVYPLFFHNYFYDIVTCKFILFVILTILLLISMVFFMPSDTSNETVSIQQQEKSSRWYAVHLRMFTNRSDIFIILLFVVNMISVFLSYDKLTSIVGTDGRNAGLITIFCYVVLYFILSRKYQMNEQFFLFLFAGSVPVSILGILNYLDIDFLGFYNGLDYSQRAFYFSTLGHANVYASYFSLILPAVYIFYLRKKGLKNTILYGCIFVINVLGLIVSGCESAGIILFVTYLLTIIVDHNILNLPKYLSIHYFILLALKVLSILNKKSVSPRKEDVIFSLLIDNRNLAIIFSIMTIIILVIVLITRKKSGIHRIKREDGNKAIYLRNIGIGILFFIPFIYLCVLIFFSVFSKNTDLGKYENILRFNDQYGSYRGYIWRIVCKEFMGLKGINKLFGIGSDALDPYLQHIYGDKMYYLTGAYYDNAHNEFLQYLITTGITGFCCFYGFVISQIRKVKTDYEIIIACCIICYLAQSIVNINQVVTTPLLIIMLSVLGKNHLQKSDRS